MNDPRRQLEARLEPEGRAWLDAAVAAVTVDPAAIRARFPAVGRHLGRGPLDADADPDDLHAWTIEDAGRLVLLEALGPAVADELASLYRFGDAAERRAILRALGIVGRAPDAIALVEDALRTNDLRLVAAALGPYAADHLDDHQYAHGVLKAVFVGVPLRGLVGLERRVTPELSRMLASYVHERVAAGRDVPGDVWEWIDRHPPHAELAAITRELDHPVPARRDAARRALVGRAT